MDFTKLTDEQYHLYKVQIRRLCRQREMKNEGVVMHILETTFPETEQLLLTASLDTEIDYSASQYDMVSKEYNIVNAMFCERVALFLEFCVADQLIHQIIANEFSWQKFWASKFLNICEIDSANFAINACMQNTIKAKEENLALFSKIIGIDHEELQEMITDIESKYYS